MKEGGDKPSLENQTNIHIKMGFKLQILMS